MIKLLYVQDQFDTTGDLQFNCWCPYLKETFVTYNHLDPHRYAEKHELEIKWILSS